jgi:hypothetical protein
LTKKWNIDITSQYKLNKLLYRKKKTDPGLQETNMSVQCTQKTAHSVQAKSPWCADADSILLVNYLEHNLMNIILCFNTLSFMRNLLRNYSVNYIYDLKNRSNFNRGHFWSSRSFPVTMDICSSVRLSKMCMRQYRATMWYPSSKKQLQSYIN